MSLTSYKDLEVWKKSVELVSSIYMVTKLFPKDEIYTLTNQMRRAAISIPSNIAEGRAKRTTREFIRYVDIAAGSAAELETQLIISEKLGYLDPKSTRPIFENIDCVGRMLNKLITGLEKKLSPNP
jgi:four helix bundle protein